MVFYHGEKNWSGTPRFAEMFAGPVDALRRHIPDFEYILFDFSPHSNEEIRGQVLLRAALMLMRHAFDPAVHDRLPEILKLILDVSETKSGLRAVETMLRYLFNEVPDLSVDKVEDIVDKHFLKDKKEVIMTVAEQLRQEGFEKGLLESIEVGLNLRFGPNGLRHMPKIKRIKKTDRLRSLQQALYTAQDIAKFERVMETTVRRRHS